MRNISSYAGPPGAIRHSNIRGPPAAWMQQEFVDLAEISIWERPVDRLRSFYPSGIRKGSGILKHDYIFITLVCGDFFVVEKVDKPVEYGILNCSHVMLTSGKGPESGHKFRFNADLKGARVRVLDLKYILEADGHTYDLLSANCWKYANGTAEKVIKLCENAAKMSITYRPQFLMGVTDLQDLKRVERVMPRDALRVIYNPWDSRNLATMALLKTRSMNYTGSFKYKVLHKAALLFCRVKDFSIQ